MPSSSARGRRGAFHSTRWSLVLEAERFSEPTARQALGELFEIYREALDAFARRQGSTTDEAHELVQGFFVRLLESDGLRGARRDRGRFRSYLLAAFRHFLSHQRQHQRAQKRGGGQTTISIDDAATEFHAEPTDRLTPEDVFARRWALALLDRVLDRLRCEWRAAGKEELFETLKGHLTVDEERLSYRQISDRTGLGASAARVAVHRLRRRFAALLRAEVAATVERPDEVDDELRFLLAALGNP